MSSPSSVQIDPGALAAGLISVAERSFFAYAEPAPPDRVVSVAGGWYSASVAFRGPFDGAVAIALPVGLARDLCAAFLGEDAEALAESAVSDLAGEFANMTCGTYLTGLTGFDTCFELSHPDVSQIACAPAGDFVVAVNDLPVIVTIRRGGAAA
jgi:chemotaxis phosphatase CheX-like protein